MLYPTGATIYMASKNKEKAEAAIEQIMQNAGESEGDNARETGSRPLERRLRYLPLDLADLDSVRRATTLFTEQEDRLDILWNNAGIGARTRQGLDMLVGVHCVGAQLFTELLRPCLLHAAATAAGPRGGDSVGGGTGDAAAVKAAMTTRVLWTLSALVDSVAPENGVDFAHLDDGLKGRMANYAMSKAGVWMLGREFARRQEPDGILHLIVNPGNVIGGSYAGTPKALMVLLGWTMLHKTELGANTQLYAGLSPDLNVDHSGMYIVPWGRPWPHHVRDDIVKAMTPEEDGGLGYGKKLWAWCEQKWEAHTGTEEL